MHTTASSLSTKGGCSLRRRCGRCGTAVVVARSIPDLKNDKYVPKRNPGAADLRKLGSSDLMVSCKCSYFSLDIGMSVEKTDRETREN